MVFLRLPTTAYFQCYSMLLTKSEPDTVTLKLSTVVPTGLPQMHGIGQGNGAGPAIWAVLSTPILNMLRKQGFGCEFVAPISNMMYIIVG